MKPNEKQNVDSRPRWLARFLGAEERELLTDRTFFLLLIARFLAASATIVAPVALAFGILKDLQGTPTQLSVVMAAETVPLVTLILVGGVLADRFARNRIVVVGLVLSAVSFGVIGYMIIDARSPWWALAAAALLSGVGIAVMNPALAALVPELVRKDQLHAANGLVGIVRNTSRILALLGSGFSVAYFGGGITLLLCSAAFGVAALLFIFVRIRYRVETEAGNSFLSDLRGGWGAFTQQEWLWIVVVQSSLHFAIHGAALSVIGPALALSDLEGAKQWSLLLAFESAGTLVGSFLALRWKPKRTIFAGVLAIAMTMPTPFILLGVGAPIWAVALAIFGTGVGMSLLAVLWSVTVQSLVSPRTLSRVSSYDSLGSMLMSPLGLMLAGPAVAIWGPRGAMLGCGIILVVVTSISLLSRDVRSVTPDRAQPETIESQH